MSKTLPNPPTDASPHHRGGPPPGVRAKQLFGRRKGHPLSPRQAALMDDLLPKLRVPLSAGAGAAKGTGARPGALPVADLFPPECRERLWLEIGFGGGEHLAWQAEAHPGVGLIGCEPFVNGVASLLTAVDEAGLSNVRIHDDDVRDLLPRLQDATFERVFILFPDPWPKRRHAKRRLVTPRFLNALARVMQPGGELRIATDIGDYARTVLLAMRAAPAFRWTVSGPEDWRQRAADWPGTRYEAKAERAGRVRYYLRFTRVV